LSLKAGLGIVAVILPVIERFQLLEIIEEYWYNYISWQYITKRRMRTNASWDLIFSVGYFNLRFGGRLILS
jgi:hypothetical protein